MLGLIQRPRTTRVNRVPVSTTSYAYVPRLTAQNLRLRLELIFVPTPYRTVPLTQPKTRNSACSDGEAVTPSERAAWAAVDLVLAAAEKKRLEALEKERGLAPAEKKRLEALEKECALAAAKKDGAAAAVTTAKTVEDLKIFSELEGANKAISAACSSVVGFLLQCEEVRDSRLLHV